MEFGKIICSFVGRRKVLWEQLWSLCMIEIFIYNMWSHLDTFKNDLKLRKCWSSSPSHSICGAYKLNFSISVIKCLHYSFSNPESLCSWLKSKFKLEIIFLQVKGKTDTKKDSQSARSLSITSQISVNLTILSSCIIKMLPDGLELWQKCLHCMIFNVMPLAFIKVKFNKWAYEECF